MLVTGVTVSRYLVSPDSQLASAVVHLCFSFLFLLLFFWPMLFLLGKTLIYIPFLILFCPMKFVINAIFFFVLCSDQKGKSFLGFLFSVAEAVLCGGPKTHSFFFFIFWVGWEGEQNNAIFFFLEKAMSFLFTMVIHISGKCPYLMAVAYNAQRNHVYDIVKLPPIKSL